MAPAPITRFTESEGEVRADPGQWIMSAAVRRPVRAQQGAGPSPLSRPGALVNSGIRSRCPDSSRTRRASLPAVAAARSCACLRHYYVSGLIAAGCDVVTVQRALGHGSATITLDTYAHLWPTAEDKTRAAAASMIAETLDAADSVRTVRQR